MAEWLGNGLQNRVQQFDSAWYLKKRTTPSGHSPEVFFDIRLNFIKFVPRFPNFIVNSELLSLNYY